MFRSFFLALFLITLTACGRQDPVAVDAGGWSRDAFAGIDAEVDVDAHTHDAVERADVIEYIDAKMLHVDATVDVVNDVVLSEDTLIVELVPHGPCQGLPVADTVFGDYEIENSLDLEAFAQKTCLTHELRVSARALTTIALDLEVVGGDVKVIDCHDLETLDIGQLTDIGGSLVVGSNPRLSTLNTSGLETLGMGVYVSGNAALDSLDLSLLTHVPESLSVADVGGLHAPRIKSLGHASSFVNIAGELDVSGLETADSLVFENNGAELLNLPRLESLGDLTVVGNEFVALSMPLVHLTRDVVVDENNVLQHIHLPDVIGLSSLEVTGNNALITLDLQSLASTDGDLMIANDAGLTDLRFGSLTTVGGKFWLEGVNGLETLSLPSLTGVGGYFVVGGPSKTSDNVGLELIDLPLVEALADVFVQNNVSLTSVDVPQLSAVGGQMYFRNNPELDTCIVTELVSSVVVTGDVANDGNGSSCRPDPCLVGACVVDCRVDDNFVCQP